MTGTDGEGAAVDRVEALRAAAEAGDAAAHYGLARLYYVGQGVPRDVEKSIDHLRRAVRAGSAEAIVETGRVYRAGDVGWDELAEAQERALARYRPDDFASLGVLFELYRGTVQEPPPETAMRWYREAARLGAVRGDDDAAWTLARLLETVGRRENLREAAYWYQSIARRDERAARSASPRSGGAPERAGTRRRSPSPDSGSPWRGGRHAELRAGKRRQRGARPEVAREAPRPRARRGDRGRGVRDAARLGGGDVARAPSRLAARGEGRP